LKKALTKIYSKDGQDRLLPKFSLFIFDRSRTAALIWLVLTVFGIFSYTSLLKREGFPSINIPYSVISGVYIANDPAAVDRQIAKPISDLVLKDERVKSVITQSQGTFFSVVAQYGEDADTNAIGKEIEQKIKDAKILPPQASLKVETPKIGFTERGDDAVVSVYAEKKGLSPQALVDEGERVAAYLKEKRIPGIEKVSVVDPFVTGVDPVTGQTVVNQKNFDRYGVRENNQNAFYDSVAVGLVQRPGTDVIEMDTKLREAVATYNRDHNGDFQAAVSASYAPDIKDQIGGLQQALLEGLLAILVVGSIVIAIRASAITVLAMITVLAITLGVLYAIGYSLNTITLFSLILCMALIVDDTIIMVEAIDAQRRKRKDPRETIHVATRKVSRAMVAATSTAALSFAPLLFVGGILGGFIRAIPVTVITSLVVSLLVALVFIPLFAKYILLGKKQMGAENMHEPAAGIEAKVAQFIGKPMLWARHSKKKLFTVGIMAVIVGFGFIMAGGYLFQKVTFNIFPPSKDSNGLAVQLTFPPNTTTEQAEAIADRADAIVAEDLGENFKSAAYYAMGDNHQARLTTYLISFKERDPTAPQLQAQLNERFKTFEGARVEVNTLDIGPPVAAFAVNIETDNRAAAEKLAKDLNDFLANKELTRVSGEKARIVSTAIADPGTYTRNDGKLYLQVSAKFDGTDTTTLVTLAQDAVKKEFNEEKLRSYGLQKDDIVFDLGQEEENQESFGTLVMAFPILLLVIYLLLSIQFRSLLQPLLIFMAIPFSLFGITLGLYLTDNAFSFFAMLGFFALIGLSIKNTILLTDYANQLRREGAPAVDAAVGALGERFRPLIATSLTAVASLIPLFLSDPFWEGLTAVLIFGLLSSTFLVITVFPYYYLGAEYLRLRISRKMGLAWLALTIATSVALVNAKAGAMIPAAAIGWIIVLAVIKRVRRRSARA
jgi:multidrug efflux pump subunit AcrB